MQVQIIARSGFQSYTPGSSLVPSFPLASAAWIKASEGIGPGCSCAKAKGHRIVILALHPISRQWYIHIELWNRECVCDLIRGQGRIVLPVTATHRLGCKRHRSCRQIFPRVDRLIPERIKRIKNLPWLGRSCRRKQRITTGSQKARQKEHGKHHIPKHTNLLTSKTHFFSAT